MATIAISNLQPMGSDFFADPESYLGELSDRELRETQGGCSPVYATAALLFVVGIAAGWQA